MPYLAEAHDTFLAALDRQESVDHDRLTAISDLPVLAVMTNEGAVMGAVAIRGSDLEWCLMAGYEVPPESRQRAESALRAAHRGEGWNGEGDGSLIQLFHQAMASVR